jgi:hypothetical protein
MGLEADARFREIDQAPTGEVPLPLLAVVLDAGEQVGGVAVGLQGLVFGWKQEFDSAPGKLTNWPKTMTYGAFTRSR